MRNKILLTLIVALMAVSCLIGCGNTDNSVYTETAEDASSTDKVANDSGITAEESNATIQDEIAAVQAKSDELISASETEDMNQTGMTENATERYDLWDKELNSLWSRLSDELDDDTKADLLEEQREWISRKEESVKVVGEEADGGSLQACLEAETGADLTQVRVYKLAGILAKLRGEDFVISDEMQAALDSLDPDIDNVFALFEGTHVTNYDNGDCIIIEKLEDSDFDPSNFEDGVTWVVSVTGGSVYTDKDVYTFSPETITFKLEDDSYAKLSLNMAGGVDLSFGADSDCTDETISSDD